MCQVWYVPSDTFRRVSCLVPDWHTCEAHTLAFWSRMLAAGQGGCDDGVSLAEPVVRNPGVETILGQSQVRRPGDQDHQHPARKIPLAIGRLVRLACPGDENHSAGDGELEDAGPTLHRFPSSVSRRSG